MIKKLLEFLIYILNKWENRESLKTLGAARSSQWPKLRTEWLKENPRCYFCGRVKNVVPHHKKPFNRFPELELEKSNLISACESAGMNCHITFCHLGNFQFYNPGIEIDAPIWKEKIINRIK